MCHIVSTYNPIDWLIRVPTSKGNSKQITDRMAFSRPWPVLGTRRGCSDGFLKQGSQNISKRFFLLRFHNEKVIESDLKSDFTFPLVFLVNMFKIIGFHQIIPTAWCKKMVIRLSPSTSSTSEAFGEGINIDRHEETMALLTGLYVKKWYQCK